MLLAPSFLISQCLSGDCENGFGEYKFKNGVYEGDFVAGNLFGQGIFTTKRGYSYEGQWNSNKKAGFAKEIIKKVGKLAHALGMPHRDIHKKWLDAGGPRHGEASINDLKNKNEWLEHELKKLFSGRNK